MNIHNRMMNWRERVFGYKLFKEPINSRGEEEKKAKTHGSMETQR